jgi:hypothetical protein
VRGGELGEKEGEEGRREEEEEGEADEGESGGGKAEERDIGQQSIHFTKFGIDEFC